MPLITISHQFAPFLEHNVSHVTRRHESDIAMNKSSDILKVFKLKCKFCEFSRIRKTRIYNNPKQIDASISFFFFFIIKLIRSSLYVFQNVRCPFTFSLLYFAVGKERSAVSSHEQTVIITIVRPIGRKIKIPAPPKRVLARLSSRQKNENGFFH